MAAVDKVIEIATAEIGYLEKRTNNHLDSKTANAGQNNYTKYWRDIKPDYQGQPWCACFVTWCFEKAFGRENTKKLLKHYPYVYCPTMASLFEQPRQFYLSFHRRTVPFLLNGLSSPGEIP